MQPHAALLSLLRAMWFALQPVHRAMRREALESMSTLRRSVSGQQSSSSGNRVLGSSVDDTSARPLRLRHLAAAAAIRGGSCKLSVCAYVLRDGPEGPCQGYCSNNCQRCPQLAVITSRTVAAWHFSNCYCGAMPAAITSALCSLQLSWLQHQCAQQQGIVQRTILPPVRCQTLSVL
eukprot:TRINITY_DN7298_c0_g1_i4.p2 TRINITY_DN7298_c0_g1~~TRINITY_DN7298_c0_g1_i4.p2  ORF type:complete len:177 (-),score=12.37 TRINITY_DN7298_c0_g1_i4:107-637(-)